MASATGPVAAPSRPTSKWISGRLDEHAVRWAAAHDDACRGTPRPDPHRRRLGWPWLLAATVAGGVAVQLAAPQWWLALGQRAMQGVDDLRAGRTSHDAPTLPVAVSAIATPPPDVEAQAPEFVPLPMPVVTTSRGVATRSNPPPPPPVVAPSRRSSSAAERRAKAGPVARSAAVIAVGAETEAPAAASEDAPNESTAMADPTPTPTPLEDPPRESPAIQEPPPPESPPDGIREPPPAEMPTPIPNEGPTAP